MRPAPACSCDAGCVGYEPERARLFLVVLWHGRGPREGDVLRPLAEALTVRGAAVAVPEWDSTSADRGRRLLSGSLPCAVRRADGLPVVLAGWSLGGAAALSVALGAVEGPRPVAVVGLAANVRSVSPLNGVVPLDVAREATISSASPMVLVHGLADHIVEPAGTRTFVELARSRGLRIEHREVETDHAGVIGTEFDAVRGLCVPSETTGARTGLAAALQAVFDALRLADAAS